MYVSQRDTLPCAYCFVPEDRWRPEPVCNHNAYLARRIQTRIDKLQHDMVMDIKQRDHLCRKIRHIQSDGMSNLERHLLASAKRKRHDQLCSLLPHAFDNE